MPKQTLLEVNPWAYLNQTNYTNKIYTKKWRNPKGTVACLEKPLNLEANKHTQHYNPQHNHLLETKGEEPRTI